MTGVGVRQHAVRLSLYTCNRCITRTTKHTSIIIMSGFYVNSWIKMQSISCPIAQKCVVMKRRHPISKKAKPTPPSMSERGGYLPCILFYFLADGIAASTVVVSRKRAIRLPDQHFLLWIPYFHFALATRKRIRKRQWSQPPDEHRHD